MLMEYRDTEVENTQIIKRARISEMRATALGAAGAGEGEGLGRIGQEARPQCTATGVQDGSKVLMISPCSGGVGGGRGVDDWMRAIHSRDPPPDAQLQLEGWRTLVHDIISGANGYHLSPPPLVLSRFSF